MASAPRHFRGHPWLNSREPLPRCRREKSRVHRERRPEFGDERIPQKMGVMLPHPFEPVRMNTPTDRKNIEKTLKIRSKVII